MWGICATVTAALSVWSVIAAIISLIYITLFYYRPLAQIVSALVYAFASISSTNCSYSFLSVLSILLILFLYRYYKYVREAEDNGAVRQTLC